MRRPTVVHIVLLISLSIAFSIQGLGQKTVLRTFRLSEVDQVVHTVPPSNSVSHITIEGTSIYIGTSKGLAKSTSGGRSWDSYRSNPNFANDGIFSIAALKDTVWAATGFDKEVSGGSVQTGSGYAYSTDAGQTWKGLSQTLDARGDSLISYGINDSVWILPVVVPEQNVTFDISLTSGSVWIASWASGLRKSTNNGRDWKRILLPPDNRNSLHPYDTLWTYARTDTFRQRRIFDRFDPRHNNNMLAFAVLAIDRDTIWCGTAGGVNKSTNGGVSWQRFAHQNQSSPILGNWVIAIKQQSFGGKKRLWTTNWRADDPAEQFGVSYTDDGGRTWKNLLHGIRAYDFAFLDSIAYIATDDGIYRTSDGGRTFARVSEITDPTTRQVITTTRIFGVGTLADTVFVGTGDGLASTIDDGTTPFGSSWKIYKTYDEVGTTATTYAYPNPFSPGSEIAKIHYGKSSSASSTRSVNIDIFDFGMNRITTLVHGAIRTSSSELDEYWDGRADDGSYVPNGVYFYRIKIDNNEPLFGKILVLQ